MPGSLSKYWRVRQDRNGTPLHWPGTMDGYPLRGTLPPITTQQEYEQIPLVYDASGAIFELPRQMQEYLDVIDHCANGWWQLRQDQFLGWDAEKKVMCRFVQWLEIHGEASTSKSPPAGLFAGGGSISTDADSTSSYFAVPGAEQEG